MQNPTGISLKVTTTSGGITFPSFEAHGWDEINEIIYLANTIAGVRNVGIKAINYGEKVGA